MKEKKITLEELIETIDNGSRHLLLFDQNGVIILETIWQNYIPKRLLKYKVYYYNEEEYKIKVGIEK